MGERSDMALKARCPLYEGVVHTKTLVGIQCEFLRDDFGFQASCVLRVKDRAEMVDLKEIFCDDRYEACPYYQAYCDALKRKGRG